MKNLTKKMIAMVAVMGAMHAAKADGVEKDFEPVAKSGENKSIEIVNGQLLVRCTEDAEIGGEKTPYVYVGTNTDHFAQSAFAQGGLTNLAQHVHAGNGKIYMTAQDQEKDPGVYTTTISAPNAALNGVLGKVEKVADLSGDSLATQVLGKSDKMLKVFNNKLYYANGSGIHEVNGGYSNTQVMQGVQEILDFIVVPQFGNEGSMNSFILFKDSEGKTKAKSNQNFDGLVRIVDADAIVLGDDGKTVGVISGNKVTTYDGSNGATKIAEKTIEMSVTTAPKKIKSAVIANNAMYYVTAKTIGYERMD